MMFKINLRKGLSIAIILSLSFLFFSKGELVSLLKKMNNSIALNGNYNEGMVDLKNPEIKENGLTNGSSISTYGWELSSTF